MSRRGRKVSYETYIWERTVLQSKGYQLREAVDRNEYIQLYHGAKDFGMNNIAKTLAKKDLIVNRSQAKTIMELGKDLEAKVKLDPKNEKYTEKLKQFKALIPNMRTQADVMRTIVKMKAKQMNKKTGKEELLKTPQQQLFAQLMDILGSKEDTVKVYGY